MSNALRWIAEWLSRGLDYVVLISLVASVGSFVFAVIQVRRKKKATELRASLQADLDAVDSIAGLAPIVASLSSRATQGAGLTNVSETGFAQRISGQGRGQGPEKALASVGPLKGEYATSSYSQR